MYRHSMRFWKVWMLVGWVLAAGCSSEPQGPGNLSDTGTIDVGDVSEFDDVGEPELRVQPTALRLEVGESKAVVVEFRSEGGSWEQLDSVQFLVENPALVTGHGLTLTGRARGVTDVEVIARERSARIRVEVVDAGPHRVSITPSEVVLGSTGTVILRAAVETRNGVEVPNIPVEWRTHDPGVAVVTAQGGKVTANSAGVTTIEAVTTGKFAGIVGSAVVRVKPIASLEISPKGGEFRVGDEVPLAVEALSESGEVLRVNLMPRWTFSAEGIAEIRDGKLVFKNPGEFHLLAEMSGKHVRETYRVERTFTELVCKFSRCFARGSDGLWYAWGAGSSGVLGVGDEPVMTGYYASYPQAVAEQVDLVRIVSGGSISCGLTEGHQAYCWGMNYAAQTGTGAVGEPVTIPTAAATVLRFQTIQNWNPATCGLTLAGALYCWGAIPPSTWNPWQEPLEIALEPVLMAEGPFVDIQMGAYHVCVKTPDGNWACAGGGYKGDGSVEASDALVPVDTTQKLTHLTINEQTSCALDEAGKVWCWGNGYSQHLGIAGAESYWEAALSPVRTEWDDAFVELYNGGGTFRCGVNTEREVWCWGTNYSCELGQSREDSRGSDVPLRVDVPADWVKVALGDRFGCVLTPGGEIWCWGTPPMEKFVSRPCTAGVQRIPSYESMWTW